MGGPSPAQRIGAAAVWSLLLGAGLAVAEPGPGGGLFAPQSTLVLLVGLPGDVESEEVYRDQLQAWLELAATSGQAAKVLALCDDPQAVALPASAGGAARAKEQEAVSSNQLAVTSNPAQVTVLKGDRERFLAAGMDDYISKPFDLDEFEQNLPRVIGRPR